MNISSFCRRNSPWPSQFLEKSFITPVTSQLYLSATAMTSQSSQSIHRDNSEPTLSNLLDQPGVEPQNFHRRSFSGHETKSDFNVITKSRSLNQSSFTIITNPLSASGQVLFSTGQPGLFLFIFDFFSVLYKTLSCQKQDSNNYRWSRRQER